MSAMDANYYDYITKLPNMTYFFEISAARKESIIKNNGQPALLFLSLHGMKNFNQKNGFANGNQYLQSFASIMASYFDSENCCRLGGVHFAVIVDDTKIADTLRAFLERCKILNTTAGIYPHVGIYQYQTEDVSINVACDRAKLACDTLKNENKEGIAYYDQTTRKAEETHRYIIENLNRAISERWITVYYQPIVRAVNDKVCDEEALARWIDPIKGFLSPADFIPVLEEENLIYKIDLYVVERVLEKMKYFESQGIPVVSHSINLSRSDFESCDIVEEIRTRVDIAGIPRSKINIEITESVIGSDFEFMTKQISRFQELGFQVWMDDFGAGYSSLNVLKEIPFDLIKFDMSFMRHFNEKNNGKIILSELMKLAFAIGVDTVCEGVETEEQLQFLKEIGCSKIQGFFYSKPNSLEQIMERINTKIAIGFENPAETKYYETIGQINLHDLAVISNGSEKDFDNIFNMLPMAIIELDDDYVRFVRTNQSYRNFFARCFGMTIEGAPIPIQAVKQGQGAHFFKVTMQVAKDGKNTFTDEILSDGSTANFFVRHLATNHVKKTKALAVCVLSIKSPEEGITYANIAKALASDYFKLFYVNIATGKYIEYSSNVGEETMSSERHGENFFTGEMKNVNQLVYEEDREMFKSIFTIENIKKELTEQGRFSIDYRIKKDGKLIYVNMKVMRMNGGKNLIIALSNVDSQVKQKKLAEQAQQEKIIYSRLMSLSGDFICMYVVNPETEEFTEYTSSKDYSTLQLPKHGTNFFEVTRINAARVLHPDDVKPFQADFHKEKVMDTIAQKGLYMFHAHLLLGGEAKPYTVKVSLVKENGEDRLIVGIRL